MEAELRKAICGIAARRHLQIDVDPYTAFGPVAFDPTLCALLRSTAQARQFSTRDMIAAAGHDSVAALCSAMLFVPLDGITHNPRSTQRSIWREARKCCSMQWGLWRACRTIRGLGSGPAISLASALAEGQRHGDLR